MKHHSQEEILNALHVIVDVCNNNDSCNTCPLRSEKYEKCCFNVYDPSNISIVDEEPKIWRAVV